MQISYTALSVSLLLFSICADGALADQQRQILNTGCSTDPTGGDGVRHDCNSEPTTITAPDGYVFNQNTVQGGETSGAGDEHSCSLQWSNMVEVIAGSGIVQPRTATTSCHARGPSGHWAGRGWCGCSYSITMTKYR